MTFASMTTLQLGCGARCALRAFRATATGHADCPVLARGFDQLFQDRSVEAREALFYFTRVIEAYGKRRIDLAEPGCCGVTGDELSIIAALAAAQNKEDARRDAHLSWLLARRDCRVAAITADAVGAAFTSGGLRIDPPPLELHAFRAFTLCEGVSSAEDARARGVRIH